MAWPTICMTKEEVGLVLRIVIYSIEHWWVHEPGEFYFRWIYIGAKSLLLNMATSKMKFKTFLVLEFLQNLLYDEGTYGFYWVIGALKINGLVRVFHIRSKMIKTSNFGGTAGLVQSLYVGNFRSCLTVYKIQEWGFAKLATGLRILGHGLLPQIRLFYWVQQILNCIFSIPLFRTLSISCLVEWSTRFLGKFRILEIVFLCRSEFQSR